MTKPQPRQKKTARQRAEEALGVAQRRVAHLERQHKKATAAIASLEQEWAEAKARLAYVRQDPALTEGTNPPNPSGDDA